MCLIAFAVEPDPMHRLVLVANRDERYARSTLAAAEWEDAPGLIAGRDLHGGGTWLGVTRAGRFAALTNFYDGSQPRSDAPSRGGLVTGFLTGEARPDDYVAGLREKAAEFNGFNLLVGDSSGVVWYSNRGEVPPRRLGPGIYGLSNHHLDTPWPKVVAARDRLARVLAAGAPVSSMLLDILHDRTLAEERPGEPALTPFERALTAAFIVTPEYGTRSTTALVIRGAGDGFLEERTYERGSPTFTAVRHAL